MKANPVAFEVVLIQDDLIWKQYINKKKIS